MEDTMPVYCPPNKITDEQCMQGTVFLAGPIQGALDWQSDAAAILKTNDPRLCIANPRSYMWSGDLSEVEKKRLYDVQLKWEHHHLDWSLRRGCVLFWLAEEAEHIPGRAFAQTSRMELGLILGWIIGHGQIPDTPFADEPRWWNSDSRIVIGADSRFSGRKYIEQLSAKYKIRLHPTLHGTCEAALYLLEKDKTKRSESDKQRFSG